jgi:hypothetical protein
MPPPSPCRMFSRQACVLRGVAACLSALDRRSGPQAPVACAGFCSAASSSRALSAVAGIGFLGYGIYLGFIFEGGSYLMFFKAFILPALLVVNFVRSLFTNHPAEPQPYPGVPTQPYPGAPTPAQPYPAQQQAYPAGPTQPGPTQPS